MHIGYNTNGMAHHELFEAVRLLAEIGYGSVAITIDHGALPPYGADRRRQLGRLRELLGQLRMRSVIETGARFLLDPGRKHEPTLVSADRQGRKKRIDFYKYAIDCAAELGSDCTSLFSGTPPEAVSHQQAMDWLVEGLSEVLDHAARRGATIGFEPEPGMLIDSMRRYEELLGRIDAAGLQLTLDVGHLHCQGELPLADYVRRWARRTVNVHIEDMRRGVHRHLMFGEGEIDFAGLLDALAETGYQGGVYVELSGHSREAPTAARQALEFLKPIVEKV